MQPADRTGPSRDELVMATRQQPQHLPVILERDRTQVPVPQRDDRRRTCVVRVGLVLVARIQQSCSCRQRGRHVDDGLARRDELLRQQRAMTRRAFDRPQPRLERRRPTQQPLTLSAIRRTDNSPTSCSSRSITAAVCDPLCGSIPMMNTKVLLASKWNAAAGTPDAGMPFLFRATPQHGNQRDGLIARKPTQQAAGHSRDHPPAPSTLRNTPQRVTSDPPSGQSVRVRTLDGWSRAPSRRRWHNSARAKLLCLSRGGFGGAGRPVMGHSGEGKLL